MIHRRKGLVIPNLNGRKKYKQLRTIIRCSKSIGTKKPNRLGNSIKCPLGLSPWSTEGVCKIEGWSMKAWQVLPAWHQSSYQSSISCNCCFSPEHKTQIIRLSQRIIIYLETISRTGVQVSKDMGQYTTHLVMFKWCHRQAVYKRFATFINQGTWNIL